MRRRLPSFVIVGGHSFTGFPAWALWTIVLILSWRVLRYSEPADVLP